MQFESDDIKEVINREVQNSADSHVVKKGYRRRGRVGKLNIAEQTSAVNRLRRKTVQCYLTGSGGNA